MKLNKTAWFWCFGLIAAIAASTASTPPLHAQIPGLGPNLGNKTREASKKAFNDSRDRVTVTAAPQDAQALPGSNVLIAVTFDFDEGWHAWTNEGNVPKGLVTFENGIRTAIALPENTPASIMAGPQFIQWPLVHAATADVGDGPKQYAVFEGKSVALVPIVIASDAPVGKVTLTLLVTYQSCNENTCLAPVFDQEIPVTFEIVSQITPTRDVAGDLQAVFATFDQTVFDRIRSGEKPATSAPITPSPQGQTTISTTSEAPRQTFFGLELPRTDGALGVLVLIILSMIGGFILNLTPCVLPIIPIKILTISQHAGTPGRSLTLGFWMAVGVVAFWAAIGIPAALFASAADPSRLFGIWWLTLAIGAMIALMGVGIMGLFTIQLPAAVYSVNPKADTAWGSFLFGVMTAVLGLPCFGFVAGALLVGAATMPALLIMAIFTSMGLGMALPYLVLAAKPGLVSKIPRTGPASELVKQVMGLLLLAAAAYFVGSGLITLVLDEPYIGKQLHWWIVALFAAAAGLWLILRTFQISKRPVNRIAFTIIGLMIGGVAVSIAMNRTAGAKIEWLAHQQTNAQGDQFMVGAWNEYTPARAQKARDAGHIVVLDFTASWCLTCQFLKATVLDPEPVKSALASKDVVVFEVDLSSRKAIGWQTLQDLGKTGIPNLAIFTPGVEEPWQANAYTADGVLKALDDARAKKIAVK